MKGENIKDEKPQQQSGGCTCDCGRTFSNGIMMFLGCLGCKASKERAKKAKNVRD